jgi:hypothetical protein
MPGKNMTLRSFSVCTGQGVAGICTHNQYSLAMAPFPVTANPLDDPFYYLNNFMQVLDWLEHRYADVLSDDGATVHSDFKGLPRASRVCWCEWSCARVFIFGPANCITLKSATSPPLRSPCWRWAGSTNRCRCRSRRCSMYCSRPRLSNALAVAIEQPKGKKDDWLPH